MDNNLKAIYVAMLKPDWVLHSADYMVENSGEQKMIDELKMIYIRMLDKENRMMLTAGGDDVRTRMYYKHHGNSCSAGTDFAKKILETLIKPDGY